MKIIGFIINKILVEKNNSGKGKLEIKSSLDIEDIEKEEILISDKPSLKFNFVYGINYSPEIAKIEIKGSILVLDEKDESKEIIKNWKKHKILDEIRAPIFNAILDKCNIRALGLEEELGLPFHIPFPRIQIKPSNNSENKTPANYAG
jgi:hypothetical protein